MFGFVSWARAMIQRDDELCLASIVIALTLMWGLGISPQPRVSPTRFLSDVMLVQVQEKFALSPSLSLFIYRLPALS